ncbi:hypothetical protein RRG08_041044 [Elysia crispata]|uniref:Uncharacterized protein n=1 Tax=Elysia crispata TaxID=231223 RepID=A0AAE0Y8J3_9GAST|nr:hypothetical protein RRG08_041044 [Elysia crispata]
MDMAESAVNQEENEPGLHCSSKQDTSMTYPLLCPPDADVSPSLAQYSLVFPSLSSSPCFSHFQSSGTTSQSPHILLTLKERQPQQHSTSQRREGGRSCLAAMFSRIRTSLFPPVLCARWKVSPPVCRSSIVLTPVHSVTHATFTDVARASRAGVAHSCRQRFQFANFQSPVGISYVNPLLHRLNRLTSSSGSNFTPLITVLLFITLKDILILSRSFTAIPRDSLCTNMNYTVWLFLFSYVLRP